MDSPRGERAYSTLGGTSAYTVLVMMPDEKEQQKDMKIPSELIPRCPVCGAPMTVNLRADDTFVEDEGWHAAARRYEELIGTRGMGRILYLELGVGYNTPGIIKYSFWQMTAQNPKAIYCVTENFLVAFRYCIRTPKLA